MGLFVDTVSADVTLKDLGIVLVHPTTNYDLSGQFSAEQIRESEDLFNAIKNDSLAWKKTSGGTIQPSANYDPDYLELEQEKTGDGIQTPKEYTLANSTLTLTLSSESVLFFTGSTSGQILKLPNASSTTYGDLEYTIYNRGTADVSLRYQDNSNLYRLPPLSKTVVTLQSPSANGNWFIDQTLYKAGFNQYHEVIYSGDSISAVNFYNSASFVTANRIARSDLTYTSDNLTSESFKIYDVDGTTVLVTYTWTHTYSGDVYQSSSLVVT